MLWPFVLTDCELPGLSKSPRSEALAFFAELC
jgi:hypothetical protein